MLERNDKAAIILIAAISFTVAFFGAGALISTPEDRAEAVLEVSEFSSELPLPDPRIFNATAINPTEEISVQDADTSNPFTGGGR